VSGLAKKTIQELSAKNLGIGSIGAGVLVVMESALSLTGESVRIIPGLG